MDLLLFSYLPAYCKLFKQVVLRGSNPKNCPASKAIQLYRLCGVKISYPLFQVAELKRKLELEEMHKFRQMSRPKFSNSTKIIDHEKTPNNNNINEEIEDETFLENDYYTYSSNEA